jgi:hypothetical protein
MAEESRVAAKAARRLADVYAWAGDLIAAAKLDKAAAIYLAEAERYESLPSDEICPRF